MAENAVATPAGQAADALIDQDGTALTQHSGSADSGGSMVAFTFGDPEPVLDRVSLLGFIETASNGRWYTPPVSMDGLARAFDLPGPHASCIRLKVNLLAKHFQPSRWLDRTNFRKWALDFLSLGNGYLERRDNLAGRPLKLEHSLGRFTRRGTEEGRYFFVQGWKSEHEFEAGSVFHLMQEHPAQEIYGVPEFFGALQAGLLDEAATLFRRKYYKNGSHAGFVFVNRSEKMTDLDSDAIRKALKEAKGPGNFRNLYVHAPGDKEKAIEILPIGEVTAKDEFFNVKRVSRNEMLAAHRTPPQLVAIIPENNGGFGDVEKAEGVFFRNEIEPLISRFEELNDWMGLRAVQFMPYEGAGPE